MRITGMFYDRSGTFDVDLQCNEQCISRNLNISLSVKIFVYTNK